MKKQVSLILAAVVLTAMAGNAMAKLPVPTKNTATKVSELDVSAVDDTISGFAHKQWSEFNLSSGQKFIFFENADGIVNEITGTKKSTFASKSSIVSYEDDKTNIGGTVVFINKNGFSVASNFTFQGTALGLGTTMFAAGDDPLLSSNFIFEGATDSSKLTITKGTLNLDTKNGISGGASLTADGNVTLLDKKATMGDVTANNFVAKIDGDLSVGNIKTTGGMTALESTNGSITVKKIVDASELSVIAEKNVKFGDVTADEITANAGGNLDFGNIKADTKMVLAADGNITTKNLSGDVVTLASLKNIKTGDITSDDITLGAVGNIDAGTLKLSNDPAAEATLMTLGNVNVKAITAGEFDKKGNLLTPAGTVKIIADGKTLKVGNVTGVADFDAGAINGDLTLGNFNGGDAVLTAEKNIKTGTLTGETFTVTSTGEPTLGTGKNPKVTVPTVTTGNINADAATITAFGNIKTGSFTGGLLTVEVLEDTTTAANRNGDITVGNIDGDAALTGKNVKVGNVNVATAFDAIATGNIDTGNLALADAANVNLTADGNVNVKGITAGKVDKKGNLTTLPTGTVAITSNEKNVKIGNVTGVNDFTATATLGDLTLCNFNGGVATLTAEKNIKTGTLTGGTFEITSTGLPATTGTGKKVKVTVPSVTTGNIIADEVTIKAYGNIKTGSFTGDKLTVVVLDDSGDLYGDVTVGNIKGDAILTGKNVKTGNVIADATFDVTAEGDITTGTITAPGAAIVLNPGKNIKTGNVIADSLKVTAAAGAITVGNVKAAGDVELVADKDIKTGTISSADFTATAANITAGNVTATGAVLLTATKNIKTGNVAADELTAATAGDITTGDITKATKVELTAGKNIKVGKKLEADTATLLANGNISGTAFTGDTLTVGANGNIAFCGAVKADIEMTIGGFDAGTAAIDDSKLPKTASVGKDSLIPTLNIGTDAYTAINATKKLPKLNIVTKGAVDKNLTKYFEAP